MKFYNNNNGIIVICILFLLQMYIAASGVCSCTKRTPYCNRHEILGVQFNHFFFFLFLGVFFPSYFWTFFILGVLWEFLEIMLDRNEEWTIKNIGGCLSDPPSNLRNTIYNYKVYKGIDKYLNPIDRFFNIKNSTIHAWHGSIAEIVPNVIGFGIGILINKYLLFKYFKNM